MSTEESKRDVVKEARERGPSGSYRKSAPLSRFWAKVNKTSTCWLWTASTGYGGYGSFYDGSKHGPAHRYAYIQFVGPIPEGMEVCHACDNKICVNPSHLYAATHRDNMRHAAAHGLMGQKQEALTCRNGHPRTAENLIPKWIQGVLYHTCRICRSARNKRTRKKKAA